ncbi:MAG: FHA domain-containing protein [Blastocatellia bacterium]|nr:FHA domain-containing protein [Blastocatellia bacterium]MDW8255843.1 FHA domain-containing protein [Acidobacteriota bacterium]
MLLRGGRIGREFPVTEAEVMIGRWDAEHGIFPEIDLDEEDPEAKVSRRHARIFYRDGRFWIEDLGSLNGTFVNRGPRLRPGQARPLEHGDEIIVGKTFLRFLIEGV